MKTPRLIPLLSISLALISCKSAITVNSDIQEESVESVALSPYTSVQKRDPSLQDPNLALGVAISGGGSRAQYFGLGVLMGLEEIAPAGNNSLGRKNLLQDIDYFSTVSGGGFAAGYYLTLKKHGLMKDGQTLRAYWLSALHDKSYPENIDYNATINMLIGSNFRKYEASRRNPSFPDRIDRQLLQKGRTLPDSQTKIESILLSDIFKTGNEIPTLPMLVANGTIYKNAERIPFMPHIIQALDITESRMPIEPLKSGSGKYNDGYTLPLKYAIAASSAFPGLIPQVKFTSRPRNQSHLTENFDRDTTAKYIRIVDGGVVDNLGYVTLLELLREDPVKKQNKKAIIIDCSGVGMEERYAENYLRRPDILTRSLFYTLQTKYRTFTTDIEHMMDTTFLAGNYVKLGITSLRDTAQKIVDDINYYQQVNRVQANEYSQMNMQRPAPPSTIDANRLIELGVMSTLRADAGKRLTKKQRDNRWDRFYTMFDTLLNRRIKAYNLTLEPVEPGVKASNLDRLKTSDFGKFGREDKVLLLLLYELASLVETNVMIRSDRERSILVLAGRYTTYIRRNKLGELYEP